MNNTLIIIFSILAVISIIFVIISKKINITNILIRYSGIYKNNAFNEKDRKLNLLLIFFVGIVPYALGLLLFFSFQDYFLKLDPNILIQFNTILMTVLCLLLGMNLNNNEKPIVAYELFATLIIAILLIIISVFLLVFYCTMNQNLQGQRAFMSLFFAFESKIFVLFFISLKRIFVIKAK